MKLVALVGLCLVTRCGITAAGVNGPKVVEEGSDVILPCSLSTKENIQLKLFDWKKVPQKDEVFMYDAGVHYNNGRSGQSETFKGRVFHFPNQLEYGNASIIIRNTKVTDRGNYTCHFPRLQPPQTFYVELVVGAAPEPYVTILEQTKDWSRLQCRIQGASPEPKVEWKDSNGNILPAEKPQVSKSRDRYDVILQVKVTKTDNYSCVATQETICHQTYTEIHVYIHGDGSEGNSESSTGSVVAAVLGAFFVGVLIGVGVLVAVLVYRRRIKQGSRPVPTSDTLCGSTSGAPSGSTSGSTPEIGSS